ncbi:efflux RND transporter periplasmic adaptor subunit [Fonticella tunisiensis]|uniref:HlyD family secretion protein n=1 Tax=Fonticella tunisiensis TaxID=1096341 RepID=A0A4R7KUF6_9CLOT|nr:efflux RND transporter periplasmic adaptor subunit [Fonticella tunisiensis]TDT63713.1 HlyD family secretion protein [Fonticella tunisiensis]
MKRKVVKAMAITLSILVVAVGVYFVIKKYTGSKGTASNNSFLIQTVRKSDITVSVKATGSAYASVIKEVAPNNSGELKNLNVKIGDTVKKGDVLFKVESEQLRQQLNNAKSNLETQKLKLESLKKQLENLNSSENANNNTNNNAQRTSAEDLQNQIDMQELQVEDAQNNLNYAQQQYNNMTVKSPINGVITAINNNNGDDVQSGKPVLTIVDTSSLKIKASVDELDISKVKAGQKVKVTFNAIENKTYDGVVESISDMGTTQNNVTTYDTVITLNDISGVKVGMTANIEIETASKQQVLVVPVEALIERNGKSYVMVEETNNNSSSAGVNDETNTQRNGVQQGSASSQSQLRGNVGDSGNSSFQRGTQGSNNRWLTNVNGRLVEVKTGIENENYVEITEGLTEGQRILVTIPQTSGSSNNTNNTQRRNNMGGFGGGIGMPGFRQ